MFVETEFERRFSKIYPEKIEEIKDPIAPDGAPEYFTLKEINGRPLAFLGITKNSDVNESNLKGNYFREVKITLPPMVRMLKIEEFYNYLMGLGENNSKIDMDHEKVKKTFYNGQISKSVVLDLCNFIKPLPNEFLENPDDYFEPIHPCTNLESKSTNNGSDCSPNLITIRGWNVKSSIENQHGFSSIPLYDPIIFYIQRKDISPKALHRIDVMFENKALGYFMLPLQNSNFGCSYFFIPNMDEYCFQYNTKGVISILIDWISSVRKINSLTDKYLTSVSDHLTLAVDDWGV